jgi:hypothetical protein
MSNIPVRNLGGVGIISDLNAYDLPPNAFSAGCNVRFNNGNVTRAPVFKSVRDLTDSTRTFGHIFSITDNTGGSEAVIAVTSDYSKIISITGSTETDVTPASITSGTSELPFTSCFLGNVAYLNRKQNVPLKKAISDADFVSLPNWDTEWRCLVLRAYKDTLVALNVQKGATDFTSMVKWSEFAQFNAVPTTWDATSTTNNAGETVLNDLVGPIIDGMVLRDSFYIYGNNEVWAMNFIGGQFVYDFRRRFNDRGIINTNCVVEVDGLHYVFDTDDIYVHDGAQPRSIIDGKDKDFVFGGIQKDFKHLCFVKFNRELDEIHFNYVSDDRLVGFRGTTTGCNRSAVYSTRNGTWTFYDLPNVTSATYAQVSTGQTYEDLTTTTYAEFAGTYIGDEDGSGTHMLYMGNVATQLGLSGSRILGFDSISGGRLSRPVELETLKPAILERIGIDMDENGAPLSSYKSLLAFYPQLGIDGQADTVSFQFGATDNSGSQPLWNTSQIFNPTSQNKLDVRIAGRYLAYRLQHVGLSDFAFSGFDVRATRRGMR